MTLLNRVRMHAAPAELPAALVFRSLVFEVLLAAPAFTTCQWRFRIAGEALELWIERERPETPRGADDRARIMSAGAATALLRVAAHHQGLALEIVPAFATDGPLALIRIGGRIRTQRADHALFRSLARCTTRRAMSYDPGVRLQVFDELRRISARSGARLIGMSGLLGHAVSSSASQSHAAIRASLMAATVDYPALLAPNVSALVTPQDRPEDWMSAGAALAMMRLAAARRGVHLATLPCGSGLAGVLGSLMREPGQVQAMVGLGQSTRHVRAGRGGAARAPRTEARNAGSATPSL